jgi:RimJ/RimL family protein N-acetyltransferase
MLVGDKVYLTTLDQTNAETARAWINDPEVNRYLLTGNIPVSSIAEAAYYEAAERRFAERSGFTFEIHVTGSDLYIGNCGLDGVDLVHRHAEVGIMIGDVTQQNHGYGRDAIRTLLRFGFETLGLHSIEIRYSTENERAAHLYRSIGFQHAGVLRQHTFIRGAWEDEGVLDMLADEWAGLRG